MHTQRELQDDDLVKSGWKLFSPIPKLAYGLPVWPVSRTGRSKGPDRPYADGNLRAVALISDVGAALPSLGRAQSLPLMLPGPGGCCRPIVWPRT